MSPHIVNLGLASFYAAKNSSVANKDIDEIKNSSFKLVSESISGLLELVIKLLSKDNTMKMDDYINTVDKTMNSINAYYTNKGEHKIENLNSQRDFIIFIIGICKGDFEMIGVLANKLGYFDNQMVKDLFAIFMKYQSVIFENGSFGLPEVARGLRTAYFFAENDLKQGNYRKLSKRGVQIASNALRQGARAIGNEVKREAKEFAEDTMKETGTYVTDLLYKDLFNMFDKDKSGYINYDEF